MIFGLKKKKTMDYALLLFATSTTILPKKKKKNLNHKEHIKRPIQWTNKGPTST